ncbi:MAG: glycosyl hydrolase [Eubacteriales bacterium]
MNNLINDIKQNAVTHGSLPFWSWNDKLEPQELRRQINVMHSLGMKGFFMHARGGLDTEYLSDEWYDCINQCVDEAKKLGMEAWSYDENGWPSGFAGGLLLADPANHATWLDYTTEKEFPSGEDILGIYVLENNKIIKVSNPCAEEYHVIRQKYDASYVDTMDADITRKFINATHEEYKKRVGFNESMPGFFTDEPQYYRWATPWSNKMPQEFDAKYGYSVFSALPALFIDFEGSDEFRYDYFKLCHELFINNFIKLLYEWCEENGCKITGHAVEESFLAGQMWCCGGVMPFYEYEHIPGIDYLGRGLSSDLSPKQIGSACAQLGKREVISEMFACCGWDVTPSELKRIAELQYAGGVNMMCQHLYSYSIRGQRKRDYPAHYSEHLPWQNVLGDFNRFFNNLGYTLSLGEESVNTLVIHPIHSAYMKYKRPQDGHSIADLERHTTDLSNLLSRNQIPYHWGDENMMAKIASVEGKKIKVGLCTYNYVIVPYSYTLDSTTSVLLKEYLSNGGKLWLYSDAPACIDGRISDMSWLKTTAAFGDIKAAAESKITLNGTNVPALRQQIRNTENGRIIYITNLSEDTIKDVKINITDCRGVYELDMDSLEKKPVHAVKHKNGLEVTFNFEGVQSCVLVESDEIEPYCACCQADESKPIIFENGFRFKVRPENMINLDYVQLSYDGNHFEQFRPVMHVKDLLFRSRYKGQLWLKYNFNIESNPSSLSVAVEPLDYNSFKVNGTDVELCDQWWLDRSFKTADIASYVKNGNNEIIMSFSYFQRDYVYYVLYGGVSESLRNCLNFDVEIESIYLFGGFEIAADKTRFTPSERHSICYDGSFALKEQKDEIDVGDIVTDGYPFFGGAIEIETDYHYSADSGTELFISGRFAVCEVTVNGNFAGRLMFTNHCDCSKLLIEGKNVIGLKLYNSNRNLLGPHHRHDPEPYGVGPNTFSFEKEWHDEKCPGYTDRYAFVRFGIDR